MIVQIKEKSEFLFVCFPFQFDIIFFYMKILSCKKAGSSCSLNSTGSHLTFVSHKQLPFGTRGKKEGKQFQMPKIM